MPVVGLLGGTFDPVHYGHLRPAQEAFRRLGLAELRFVPVSQSPHRGPPVASGAHRLRMVELAIAGIPGFRADTRELRRGGLSYTVSTLESLHRELPDSVFVLLIGMDQFRKFEHWHRWQEILRRCHLAVLDRPGSVPPPLPDWAVVRYAEDPAVLAAERAGRLLFLAVRPQDISASNIRDRLRRGESVDELVPETVIDYIERHDLYGPSDRERNADRSLA